MKHCQSKIYLIYTSLLLTFCLLNFTAFSQTSASIQITKPTLGENRFTICGGTREVKIRIENVTAPSPGDTLKNVNITVDLTTVPGINYAGNISVVSSSNPAFVVNSSSAIGSSTPVFNLPNLDTSGSFIEFKFNVELGCSAVPLTGSTFNNFNVIADYTVGGVVDQTIKSSGSFEVVKATLSIPQVIGNPVPGIIKTGVSASLFDPVVGVTDTVRTLVINGGFGYIDRFVYYVVDNPILTLQKVKVGNYQLVPISTNGDTTFFSVPFAAISQASQGVGSPTNNIATFQYNENLWFTEYWKADSCMLNPPNIMRGVFYGCDANPLSKCDAISVGASGIRFSIRRPNLVTNTQFEVSPINNPNSIEYREATPACYNTDSVKSIYAISNTGTGPATDIRFNIGAYPSEWNRSVDTSAVYIKTGWNGTWQKISAWRVVMSSQNGNCPSSAQTIRRANYELGNTFQLQANDTLFIKFKSIYGCGCNVNPLKNVCGYNYYYYLNVLNWEEGNGDAAFNNQNSYSDPCGLRRWSLQQRNSTEFHAYNSNFLETPANISSAQTATLKTSTTNFVNTWLDNYLGTGRRSDYDNAAIRYYYVFDDGFDWVGANGDINTNEFILYGADNINKWKPSSVKYTDNGYGQKDTLIVTYKFIDYPFGTNISMGNIITNYRADCSEIPVTCKTPKRIRQWGTFTTNSNCTSCNYNTSQEQTIDCIDSINVNIYCVCTLPCTGIVPLKFDLTRKNFDLGDNNDNKINESGETIDYSKVTYKRSISGDTIIATYIATFATDATNTQWENAYNVLNVPNSALPSLSITPVGSTLTIKDVNASGTLIGTYSANVLQQIPLGNQIYTNLSPDSLRLIGNTGIPNSFNAYSAGDTVELKVYFRLFDSSYVINDNEAPYQFLTFSESSFAAHTSLPTSNRYACDNYNDRMMFVRMRSWSWAWGEWQQDLGGCTPGNIDNYYTGFLIGGGYDYFPYEVRKPKAELTRTKYVKDSRMEWANLLVGGSTLFDNFGDVNLNPYTSPYITIVADTMYFNAQQYLVDFRAARPSIRWDQGYYFHFTPQITGTCKVPISSINIVDSFTENNYSTDPNVFGTNKLENLTKLTISKKRSNATWNDPFYYSYYYRYTKAAQLVVQAGVTTQQLLGGEACFEVTINNIGESEALLTWLNIKSPSGGVVIKSVTDVTNPSAPINYTPTFGIYRIGSVASSATQPRTLRFCVSTNNCSTDSLVLQAGWNCTQYPLTLQEAECGQPYKFYVTPAQSTLDMILKQPATDSSVDLCTEMDYILQITSANLGNLNHINLQFDLPTGQSYVPGSMQYAYPNSTSDPALATFSGLKDPIKLYGNTYKINVTDSTVPPNVLLATTGLPGTNMPGQNFMFVKFRTRFNCGFLSGSRLNFTSWGYDACNNLSNYKTSTSGIVTINALPAIYKTSINVSSSNMNPCNNEQKRVVIDFTIQAGSVATGNQDSIRIVLPPGITYVLGSVLPTSNAYSTNPRLETINGQQILYFKVVPGLGAGKRVRFSFLISSTNAQQDCRSYPLIAQTYRSQNANCSGTTCSVLNISDESTTYINFIKPDISITSFTASSVGVPPNQEDVTYTLNIFNAGVAVLAGNTTNVNIYSDVNANGQYEPSIDEFLFTASTTFAIPASGSLNLTGHSLVAAGKTCKLIAVINPQISCVCKQAVSFIAEPDITMPFVRDTFACSGIKLDSIGPKKFNSGITYQWYGYNGASTTPLSSTSISPVSFQQSNTTGSQINNTYVIRVVRNNTCVSYDTINVKTFPVISDSITSQTCIGTTTSVSGPTNGTNYTWTTTPTVTLSTPNASSTTVPSGISQTTRFTLSYKDLNGCTANFLDIKSIINCSPLTALGDTVWYDSNKDGVQNAGEPPIAGVVIELYNPSNLTSPIRTTTTNANGFYIFDTLPQGSYRVKFILPVGKNAVFTTRDASITNDLKDSDADPVTGLSPVIFIPNGNKNMTIDAGMYYSGTIGNYVWKDVNGDGLQNDGASNGVNGAKVYLYKETTPGNYIIFDSTTTANDASGNSGFYLFKNLDNGKYKVQFPTSQSGGVFPLTAMNQADSTNGNSDADANGFSEPITIYLFGGGQAINNLSNDAGYKTNIASLGNYVWFDTNGDGLQNEPATNGINEVKIYLFKPGPSGVIGAPDQVLLDSAITADSAGIATKPGFYSFNNLQSGSYYVKFPVTQSVFPLTTQNTSTTIDGNSDAKITDGYSSIVSINVNGTGLQVINTTIDAGYRTNIGTIGNYVWYDDNNNGLQDDGGIHGVNGVKIYLYKDDGSGTFIKVDSVITANDALENSGNYLFDSLQNGRYYVQFPLKLGNYPITPLVNQADSTNGNSDANPSTGISEIVTLDVMQSGNKVNNLTIDAGYKINVGSIGNFVWYDNNGDGLQNDGATGINGVKVYLYQETAPAVYTLADSTITANDPLTGNPGFYIFNNLISDNYQIKFPTTYNNVPLTSQSTVAKTDGNSDANINTGSTATIVINTASSVPQDLNNTTIDAGYKTNIGSIGNYVWYDINANGNQDEPLATSGINGVKVYLYKDNGTGTYIVFDSTTTTNDASGNSGYYSFNQLNNGNYKVKFPTNVGNYPITPIFNQADSTNGNNDANATGFSAAVPINVFATSKMVNNPTIDAGYKTNISSIGNYVWYDNNGDGMQNEAPSNGINGVKVYLLDASGNKIDSTTTANDASGNPGYYSFTNLNSGNFSVQFPTSFNNVPLTSQTATAQTDLNSDANTSTGKTPTVTLNTASSTPQDVNNTTIDAGYKTNLGSIGDYIWYDSNANGNQDEPLATSGINGVKVYLYKDNGIGTYIVFDSTTTTNDASGNPGYYSFNQLNNGNYKVKFPTTIGNYPITPIFSHADSTNGNNDADATGFSEKVVINVFASSGNIVNNPTIDAGYKTSISSIGNYVWYDDNNDGIQNEPVINGVNGIKIYLLNSSGTIIDSTITANDATGKSGFYQFNNLNTANYQIQFPTKIGNYPISDVTTTTAITDGNNDANKATGKSSVIAINTASATSLVVNNSTIDAGYRRNIGSIGNYVWNDDNGNGLQEEAAANGINGIKVYLLDSVGNKIDSIVTTNDATGRSGYYSFNNLMSGKYRVQFPLTNGINILSPQNVTSQINGNSDANQTTGITPQVIINTTSLNVLDVNDSTLDAGYQPLGTIGNYVWFDDNKNGLQDEPATQGLNGIKVYLYKESTPGVYVVLDSTITADSAGVAGKNGYYKFKNLVSANYKVGFQTIFNQWGLTNQNIAPKTDGNSDANKTTGLSPVVKIDLTTGSLYDNNNITIDAGFMCVTTAGLDHFIECGSNITKDTLVGLPTSGIWTALASNPPGVSLSTTSNGIASVSNLPIAPTTGTWTFVYTTPNGCFDTMNITIGVTGNPNPGVNSGSNPICKNGMLELCPTSWGWSNYQWFKNGNAVPPAAGTGSCIKLFAADTGIYTLKATNGSGCWTSLSLPTIVKYDSTCNTIQNPCRPTFSTADASSVCDSTIKFTVNSNHPSGTTYLWIFGDGTTGVGTPINHKYPATGQYNVKLLINNVSCSDSVAYNITVNSCGVTPPNGLETKSLGDVIAQRLFGNAINSLLEVDGRNTNIQFTNSGIITNGIGDLNLDYLTPRSLTGTTSALVSTPTDLLTITNAKDVLAVEYVKNNQIKAVAFGTKTLTDIYSHTKPTCDRLKGAQLLEVKNVIIKNQNLVTYKMQHCTGEIEYAINLTASTNTNRNYILLQSNWFTDSYLSDEKLYNYQLWAVNFELVKELAEKIISNLEIQAPVSSLNNNSDLPIVYITKGSRTKGAVSLLVNNTTNINTATIEVKQRNVEGGVELVSNKQVNIKANAQSLVTVELQDAYEAVLNLYINNKKVDNVYINDGTWAASFNTTNTTLNYFDVIAEGTISNSNDEYRLMRNVSFSATTKDYVTAYKTIGTNCNALNLANYNSVKFNLASTGAKSVTITLISSNIKDWKDQYSYTIDLNGNNEYGVNLKDFVSSKFNASISSNNITAVSFAFNNINKGVNTNMNVNLSKARFSSNLNSVNDENDISLSPNPSNGLFNLSFSSILTEPVEIKIIEISTGRLVKTINYKALKGINKLNINMKDKTGLSDLYMINITSDTQSFKPVKMFILK